MQSVDKKYFLFNKGINTEAPLAAWPEGFSVDEQNFDLLQDGSRRRRQGISYEAGGDRTYFTAENSSLDMSDGTKTYRWKNVNNNDDVNLYVLQIGCCLYFWDEPTSGALNVYKATLDLTPYKVQYTDDTTGETYSATEEQLKKMVVSFAETEGKLIVVGQHIRPIMITIEDVDVIVEEIDFTERDMNGIEDGIAIETQVTELTDTHAYNLYNRGWYTANIEQFHTEQGTYPAKNMVQFMGMRRQTQAAFSDDDGVKVFSPDRLINELFSGMSAPQGHLTRDIFDPRTAFGTVNQGGEPHVVNDISDISEAVNAFNQEGVITISCKEAAHGVEVDDMIYMQGTVIKLRYARYLVYRLTLSGMYKVTEVLDATTFKILVPPQERKDCTAISLETAGMYFTGQEFTVTDPSYAPMKTRFSNTCAFAGRIFYGGCQDSRIADKIYFSKVIERVSDVGKCLQEADPTSEFISDLLPSDGGFITIPNLGTLRGFLAFGQALLVFSSEGVWAIGPGEGGMFSASGYSVNKLTSAGCIAPQSIVVADNTPVYWSTAGIYAILQDSNSGFLTAENVSQNVINSLYHGIRYEERTRCKAAYDPIRKRVFFLYNSRLVNSPSGDAPLVGDADQFSTSVTPMGVIDDTHTEEVTFDTALIFDVRLGAWSKWVFGHGLIHVRDMFALPTNYSTDSLNGAVRFICQEQDSQKYYMGELTDQEYGDWGVEANAFLLTGPDSLNEPERFKYAPYVHVFMRKEAPIPNIVDQEPDAGVQWTEGYAVDLTLNGRGSSVLMQPRWDWARGSDSGKMGSYVQVFREAKPHADSFGMVVTKNKVRGRGRNLFLAFKSGPKSPCWIDGWTIKYDAQVRL